MGENLSYLNRQCLTYDSFSVKMKIVGLFMIEQDTTTNKAEAQSQIVVSGKGEQLPKWFYLLFVVVFILFIVMTSLIVSTLGK